MRTTYLAVASLIVLLTFASCAGGPSVAGSQSSASASPATAPASASPATAPGSSAAPASKTGTQASGQAASAGPASKEAVRAAFLTFSANGVVPWIAKDAGLYDKQGLDVSLQYLAPATLTQALLAGKDLDVGYASAANLTTVDAKGGDLVILAASEQGGIFTLVGGAGSRALADLKGKTVAVTGIGSTGDLVLRQVLEQNQLVPNKDVSITSIADYPTIVAALKAGQIGGAVTTEPFTSIALSQGGTTLYSQAQAGVRAVQIPIVVKRAYLSGHRDMLKRLIMASMEAIHFMKTNPAAAAKYTASYMKIDDLAVVQRGIEATAKIADDDMNVPMNDLAEAIKIAAATVPEVAKLKPEDLVDLSLLQEIKASGFIEKLTKQ